MADLWTEILEFDHRAVLRWYFPRSLTAVLTAPMFLALSYVGVLSLWNVLRGMFAMVTAEPFLRGVMLPFLLIGPAAVIVCLRLLPMIWNRWRVHRLLRAAAILLLFVGTVLFVSWLHEVEDAFVGMLDHIWGDPFD